MSAETLDQVAERRRSAREGMKCRISVCSGLGCESVGAEGVLARIREHMKAEGLLGSSEVYPTCCRGLCQRGPIVEAEWTLDGQKHRHLYLDVNAEKADRIALSHAREGRPPSELPNHSQDPFFTKQTRIVLANAGEIDPEDIESCIARGAYAALEKALTEMQPAAVTSEITQSGLRGRGGAGYPTGLKWSTVAKEQGVKKYVVCNGDEGDPGAFMDRRVLESDPHRGAGGHGHRRLRRGREQGYVYVRAEYPLAIKRLRAAIQQAERLGLLGKPHLRHRIQLPGGGPHRRRRLRLRRGDRPHRLHRGERGARRGRGLPTRRTSGLWGTPTLINNVETFANVPSIVRNGRRLVRRHRHRQDQGHQGFRARRPDQEHRPHRGAHGHHPARDHLRDRRRHPRGAAFKAAQTGGPSGGCIPAQFLDMPVDYESLQQVGTIMGSGGLIVMDETSCMVDVAKFFMEFCRRSPAASASPAACGTVQMHGLLERITRGEGEVRGPRSAGGAGATWSEASLCGLGQTAPNPVVSTLRYFRDEYLAHIDGPPLPGRGLRPAGKAKKAALARSERSADGDRQDAHCIDGKPVSAGQDQTLLDVARENGIEIPTLCHLDGLSDVGACRLCLVEVEGSAKLLPACATKATRRHEGRTPTPNGCAATAGRSWSCSSPSATTSARSASPTATANCRTWRSRWAWTTSASRTCTPQCELDATHPRFVLDHNRCILCTRCVRVCDEIEGAHTWDVTGRGIHARVITDLGQPWGKSDTCTSCGKCVQVCPTGALFEKEQIAAGSASTGTSSPTSRNAREKKQWSR